MSETEAVSPEPWPETVDAAVATIVAGLSADDKVALRAIEEAELIRFHHGWGTGIRNEFGLWRGNDRLLEDACGRGCHPDEASMVIMSAVWKALRTP